MSDPISRDEAIAAVLGTSIEYHLIYGKKEPKEGFVRSLIKRLANIPPEETERKHGEWIPCNERLPDVSQRVLCQCRAGMMDVLRLTADGSWKKAYPHAEYMIGFVVAWMPLPEPYEVE